MVEKNKCPICVSIQAYGITPSVEINAHSSADRLVIKCDRCGHFELSGTVFNMWSIQNEGIYSSKSIERAKIGHITKNSEYVFINSEIIEAIINDTILRKPHELMDSWLIWYKNNKNSNFYSGIGYVCVNLYTDIGAESAEAAFWSIRQAYRQGYFEFPDTNDAPGIGGKMIITFKGAQRLAELQNEWKQSRTAFMAMAFEKEMWDGENGVYPECFRKSALRAGFDLQPVSTRAGLIDHRIQAEITAARFIIADLTHANHGAYWEAGLATGQGKPVIYTCRKDIFDSKIKSLKPHFDTQHHTTLVWEADKLSEAEENLTALIRATLPGEAKPDDN
jgi:nucleoside 2-deoxyribosyltransferase